MRIIRRNLVWLSVILMLGALGGCWQSKTFPSKSGPDLQPVDADDWPALFDDLDSDSLNQAAAESLAYLNRAPSRTFSFGQRKISAREMAMGIQRFLQLHAFYPNPEHLTQALKKEFVLYQSKGSDGEGKVLYTGYYEPIMMARKTAQPPYNFPLYSVPQDLITIDLRQFSDDLPPEKAGGPGEGKNRGTLL